GVATLAGPRGPRRPGARPLPGAWGVRAREPLLRGPPGPRRLALLRVRGAGQRPGAVGPGHGPGAVPRGARAVSATGPGGPLAGAAGPLTRERSHATNVRLAKGKPSVLGSC